MAAAACAGLFCVPLGAQAGEAASAAGEHPALVSGLDLQAIDDKVRPQDDFYRYANGRWLAATVIPADKPRYGTFDQLRELSLVQLRAIVESAAKDADAPKGSETRKLGELYASFMDEAALEALGARPLDAEMGAIATLQDKGQLPGLIAHLQRIGVSVPLSGSVHLDNRDSSRYVYDVAQDGLGMPDRDYYLLDDEPLRKTRGQYRAHVEKVLAMYGEKGAAQEAQDILALETKLAKANWSRVQNRDPVKIYNRIELADLAGLAPGYDWHRYLADTGVDGKVAYLIVSQPSYVKEFAHILADTPLPVWKSYFRWRLLSDYARFLSRAYVDQHFAFYGTALQGVPQNRPRWQRGLILVDGSIGEALGKLYVAQNFPPQSKSRAEELVKNLLEAYRRDIDRLDWMGPQTRQQAQVKLASIMTKIGYPVKWRDYGQLEIRAGDLVGNVMRANAFEFDRNVAKLGQPVDRTEWDMTPQTVNAYYNPELNEIVFPAAILQPPFFNAAADDAVNYGGIGSVIGHEISHGFDDQGSQFDEKGNLRDWWTREDHDAFRTRTRALVAEYGAFEPVSGFHLNGEQTLGENIADNSGLAIAYKAYRISLGGREPPVIDGFSGYQRFYLGFAQVWRSKTRDNFLLVLMKSDNHSDDPDRVLGALVNQPGFYEAFGVKPGDRMYLAPERRVLMW
jgi:predicted metalloendopeptidase